MKKALSLVLALLFVLALFAGCNSGGDGTTPTAAPGGSTAAPATKAPATQAPGGSEPAATAEPVDEGPYHYAAHYIAVFKLVKTVEIRAVTIAAVTYNGKIADLSGHSGAGEVSDRKGNAFVVRTLRKCNNKVYLFYLHYAEYARRYLHRLQTLLVNGIRHRLLRHGVFYQIGRAHV